MRAARKPAQVSHLKHEAVVGEEYGGVVDGFVGRADQAELWRVVGPERVDGGLVHLKIVDWIRARGRRMRHKHLLAPGTLHKLLPLIHPHASTNAVVLLLCFGAFHIKSHCHSG